MTVGKEKYNEDCPKCGKDLHFFDEGITDGFYCAECDVLCDEYGVAIPHKMTFKPEGKNV